MIAEWIFWFGMAMAPFYNILLIQTPIFEFSAIDALFGSAFIIWVVKQLVIKERIVDSRAFLFLILFLGISLISVAFSDFIFEGIKRWGRLLLLVSIFAFMMPSLMRQSKRWKIYVYLVIISGTLFGAINYYELFINPHEFISKFFSQGYIFLAELPLIYKEEIDQQSLIQNFGHEIGHWDAAILPIIVTLLMSSKKRGKLFLLFCGAISLITILFSMVKSAWGGVFLSLLYIIWHIITTKKTVKYPISRFNELGISRYIVPKKASRYFVILLILICGTFYYYYEFMLHSDAREIISQEFMLEGYSGESRIENWQFLISSVFPKNPFFGVGLRGVVAGGMIDPHSVWVGFLTETGLFGFIFWSLFYFNLIWAINKMLKTLPEDKYLVALGTSASLIGMAFRGCFLMTFIWSIQSWFIIGLGLYFVSTNQYCKSKLNHCRTTVISNFIG